MLVMRYPRASFSWLYVPSVIFFLVLGGAIITGLMPSGEGFIRILTIIEVLVIGFGVWRYVRAKSLYATCPKCNISILLKDQTYFHCEFCKLNMVKQELTSKTKTKLAADVFNRVAGIILSVVAQGWARSQTEINLLCEGEDGIDSVKPDADWGPVVLNLYRKRTPANVFLAIFGVLLGFGLPFGFMVVMIGFAEANNYDMGLAERIAMTFVIPAIVLGWALAGQYYRWLLKHPDNNWIKLSPDGDIVEKG